MKQTISSFLHNIRYRISTFFSLISAQFISFVVMNLAIFIISILAITFSYNRIVMNKVHTISDSYVSTISSSLDILESNTREIASLLKNSRLMQDALSQNDFDTGTLFQYNQEIRTQIVNIMHSHDMISMIYIGNQDYSYHYSINSTIPESTLTHEFLSATLSYYTDEELLSGTWLLGQQLGIPSDTSSLYFAQKINNLNTISPIGYIIIEVDSSFLNEAISSEQLSGISIAFIKNNHLLYKNDPQLSKELISEIISQYDIQEPNTVFQIPINGQSYYVNCCYNEALSLVISSVVAYEFLMGEVEQLHLFIAVFVIILFLLMIVLAYFISTRLVKQVSLIKNIFRDNIYPKAKITPQPFQNNEIGQIGRECENLLQKYQQSLMQTYELTIKQKETDLLRLQEQINPHFLYNTLDSIFWMCETNGNHDAAKMSLYLSRYFRSNLGKDEMMITIREEIASIQNYLAIQNIRYRNKFQFILRIEDSLYSCQILRMLLQPIIENSIFHGLEPKNGTGTIQLEVKEKNDHIYITIIDDGVGFETGNLIKGLALKNVEERIQLFYGESCGMEIQSFPNIGTTVILSLLKEVKKNV